MTKYSKIAIVSTVIATRLLGFHSFSFVIPFLAWLGVHDTKQSKNVIIGLGISELLMGISPLSLLILPLFYLIYLCSSLTKKTTLYILISILGYNVLTNLAFAYLFMHGQITDTFLLAIPFLLKQLVSGMVFYGVCQSLEKKYFYSKTIMKKV